jgi:predicted PurR-regulated permease PerM
LALIIGGKLAGFVGLLISVPMATMLIEFLNDLEKAKMLESERLQKETEK